MWHMGYLINAARTAMSGRMVCLVQAVVPRRIRGFLSRKHQLR